MRLVVEVRSSITSVIASGAHCVCYSMLVECCSVAVKSFVACVVVGGKLRHSDVIKYVVVVLGGLLFTIATVVTVVCLAVRRHKLSPGQLPHLLLLCRTSRDAAVFSFDSWVVRYGRQHSLHMNDVVYSDSQC